MGDLKSKKKPLEKKESKWVNVMQVLEGNEGKLYMKANNYKGRLVWQQYGGEDGDDVENSTFYLINNACIFDPHKDAPEFVKNVVSINLKSDTGVTVLED